MQYWERCYQFSQRNCGQCKRQIFARIKAIRVRFNITTDVLHSFTTEMIGNAHDWRYNQANKLS